MENINTKQLDRQEKYLVNELNSHWTCIHKGIWQSHGINESAFVTYIWFWSKRNSRHLQNYRDGRTWTYDPLPKLCEKLGDWTVDRLRTVIKNCVEKGLVVVGNYNKFKGDKTNWYALTDYAFNVCASADENKLIENFQQMHDKDLEIAELKKKESDWHRKESEMIAEIISLKNALNGSSTEKHASGKNPTWYHAINESNPDPSGKSTRPSGKFPAAIPEILHTEILDPNKEYIKKVCLIGNSESDEFTSKKQTSFNNINDLNNSHPQIKPVDNFLPLKGNSDLSTTCAITYSQSAPIDHMLANPYGCSEQKIKAYAESRRKCGATLTQSAWDKSVKVCLDMVREKTKLTPDEALDVLISRGDGNTRFFEIFSFALVDETIEKFEEAALKYEVTRGQEEDSVLLDLKRMAKEYGVPDSYDFDNILIKLFNHMPELSDSENEQADTFLEEIPKKQAKAITYHGEEPEYRRQIQSKQFSQDTSPPTIKDLLAGVMRSIANSEKNTQTHSDHLKGSIMDFEKETSNQSSNDHIVDYRGEQSPLTNIKRKDSNSNRHFHGLVLQNDSLEKLLSEGAALQNKSAVNYDYMHAMR